MASLISLNRSLASLLLVRDPSDRQVAKNWWL
jgi:hypothetical protein